MKHHQDVGKKTADSCLRCSIRDMPPILRRFTLNNLLTNVHPTERIPNVRQPPPMTPMTLRLQLVIVLRQTLLWQLNLPKVSNIPNGLGSKIKKPSLKQSKSQETRSLIPAPAISETIEWGWFSIAQDWKAACFC
ncbi:hypothetical protein F0562_020004 [Nyssa sinensis]|uniref:Uncharacterized protein n=1 Tax=Nyssa sinensis TaxID=561372 RepID=A0A5J5BT08_9ASTE|nr:hypothetical protein F0562_020004 [Nyssa sinensis]